MLLVQQHGDVIKWKHFPRYWSSLWGIHRSPVNSPHKDQWRGALMFSLVCAWINDWVNNRDAGDLRRHRAHYDANVMSHAETVSPSVWDWQKSAALTISVRMTDTIFRESRDCFWTSKMSTGQTMRFHEIRGDNTSKVSHMKSYIIVQK